MDWLRDQQVDGRKGEYVEPSKQTLGAYGREVIDGLRIGPQTRACYRKNWRLHVEPYPIGARAARAADRRAADRALPRCWRSRGRKDHREGEALSARTVRYIHTIMHGVLARP